MAHLAHTCAVRKSANTLPWFLRRRRGASLAEDLVSDILRLFALAAFESDHTSVPSPRTELHPV